MVLTVCPNPSIDTYAWLETFALGQTNRIGQVKEYPGGKGIHVAMALKELDCPVSLMGNWAGPNGDWIKNSPKLRGIEIVGPQLSGNTRKCFTFRSDIDKKIDNTELLEPGPYMTAQDWELFLSQFNVALNHCDLVCLSGSWPKGAPEDAYHQLLQLCEKAGKKAILDCSGSQLNNALKGKFFGLHINEDEAKAIFGTIDHSEINKILKNRVSLLALTKGKDGLFLYRDNDYIHANVVLKEVKSTVGSGDCLTAGIAYAIFNELRLDQIASYGVACGAANCMNEDLGILRRKDVDELLPLVKLTQNGHQAISEH
ncbi:1-phosphofructokinase family hexose kinase [Flagellimonas halotolerans]|uniref:PfkB family carbohydrate kinase n=1 Tax=Flagellimonas halotolerans TaxID=3112164 RepID=A0ABU6ISZ7_9FLAO|nr:MULTISPECIES: PfkB family carbohydrate kinase [unclassified Allomuricauda]MEC3966190.1 PfkB family carbohydrate kinase [Muricauda sp. SYSU M86414]MEC4266124.1 PfkB family carbohydrate kinase [Muricauda sp. SYSU M84420]